VKRKRELAITSIFQRKYTTILPEFLTFCSKKQQLRRNTMEAYKITPVDRIEMDLFMK
jgi:hypothetical protein